MIDSVFLIESVREKHREAPLFAERERYLTYLFEIGTRRERVRNVATILLHVVRLLKLDSTRPVGMDEILRGCERWVGDSNACRHRRSPYHFQLVATNWLRFQGSLITDPKPVPLFGDLLSEFLNAMRSRGLAMETLKSYRTQISMFFNWLHPRCSDFSKVRALDIEAYLEAKRDGWSRNTVAAHCRTLRTFFGYAEEQRWCYCGIRGSICSPRVPRIAENLSGPPWEEVRRVIASIGISKPADLRARAMFLLFSIYGLRSAEVRGLTLEDIDWRNGSMAVRRAKRGKTQQFPLQSEVGEAIALYLEKARPRCPCRTLFVTLNPPYRPVSGHSMSSIVSPRIKKLGIATQQFGPHSLRRACATQLLRTGSSLKDIADFLGHRDLRSVSNYAKFDPASLKNVADFSLRGVL
jgi:integrase/recombinase XerD